MPGNRYRIVFPAVLCKFVEPNLALFPVFKMDSPSCGIVPFEKRFEEMYGEMRKKIEDLECEKLKEKFQEFKRRKEGSKHTGSTLM